MLYTYRRESNGRGVTQTRLPQLALRLRMSEDMPPLLLHDFMTVQEKLYLLTFTFTSYCTQLSLLLQKAS